MPLMMPEAPIRADRCILPSQRATRWSSGDSFRKEPQPRRKQQHGRQPRQPPPQQQPPEQQQKHIKPQQQQTWLLQADPPHPSQFL